MVGSRHARHHALIRSAFAVSALLAGAGLCTAAILAPAPAAVAPLVAIVCLLVPLFVGPELSAAVRALRLRKSHAIAELRGDLARLPETEHPLGL